MSIKQIVSSKVNFYEFRLTSVKLNIRTDVGCHVRNGVLYIFLVIIISNITLITVKLLYNGQQ